MPRAAFARHAVLIAALLYLAGAVADTGAHLLRPPIAGAARYAPGRLIVAADAGLFWPIDLVAQALLGRG
jgi:hypothetical protein